MEMVPVPEIGRNNVLVKIHKTCICGTDVHIYNWDSWSQKTIPLPLTIGHEFVGEIGKMAMLGIQQPNTIIDWDKVVFGCLTIKGIYGREMFETWYKMTTMLQSGLDISGIITYRFDFRDYEKGFEAMNSGMSGKVVLDWSKI
ncbi:MAG TPA: alcohol dehydrogenase catalytic domain-containing protein [Desulfosporosinus sp.]|nr:alcohol dehydrogenase catalytic domain-containing protein [Desulfosporosinus sp.]